jgi:hypothetical protein
MFLFLRLVTLFVASVFTALGLLQIAIGVWLVWHGFSLVSPVVGLALFAVFGGWMTYLGSRVLIQHSRLAIEWRRMARRDRAFPSARLVSG